MLYDIEKSIKRLDNSRKSDDYKNLVYDLESFIIDITYKEEDESVCSAEKQSYLGKVELVNKVLDEHEEKLVFSRIRPVLSELGIRETVKGYRLMECCILEASRKIVNDGRYVMKEIYPNVAKSFGISAHNCERLCRYACSNIKPTAYFARKYPFFEELTHRTYENVTVKEIVDIFAKYVVLKCNIRPKTSNE